MSRGLLIALLALVAVAAGSAASFAYLSAGTTAGSAGRADAGGMSAPYNVSADLDPADAYDVVVAWGAATLDGAPVEHYTVKRGSTTVCANVTDANRTCTDGDLAPGTYTYTVTAVYKGWTTEASDDVTVVNLDDTPPVVESVTRTGAEKTNDASVSWTVKFDEAVTGVDAGDFSLTTALGDAGGIAVDGGGDTYTVSASTGTGDGDIRLDLVDDDSIVNANALVLGGPGSVNGDFAGGESYSVDRTAPSIDMFLVPTGTPTKAASVNWQLTFSEADMQGVALGDFALHATGVSGASITGLTQYMPGQGYMVAVATGSGDGTLRVDFDASGIADAAGNALIGPEVGTPGPSIVVDKTAPVRTSLTFHDVDKDGKVDQVKAGFSEPILNSTATAPWVLANVPSHTAATTAATSVSTSANVATVNFAEGTNAPSTAVGSFTVGLNSAATGISDAAGNTASFGATAPADRAGPVPTGIADTNGTVNGRFETGDTMTVTFSEPVTGTPASTSVVLAAASPFDTITATGLFGATTSLGGSNYITGTGTAATFGGSLITKPTSAQVRVTLAACTGTCSTNGNPKLDAGTGTMSYVPPATIKDLAVPANDATGSTSFVGGLF